MDERTLKERLIPHKGIPAETRRRLSRDSFESVPLQMQADFEDQGWVLEQKLKRKAKMRKLKPHDVRFTDRVWAAAAKLDFKDLNAGRSLSIGLSNPASALQEADVFAADDEVALVVLSRSSEELSRSAFHKEIADIQARRSEMISAIKKEYPHHKVKFILATNNYVVTESTLAQLASAGILHMDEDAVDYFLGLADHLGKAARFQLLGYLFEGTRIPGIEAKVPAIQGKMGGYTYYSFAIEPVRLLKLSYILHRNKANSFLMPTYQRLIKKTRLLKVAQFVNEGGFFPNSIIINIERGKRPLRFDRSSQSGDGARIGTLYLPQVYRAAYVIDGQHRLYGYADSPRAETELVPVVAFEGLPRAEQVRLFMQINENQQAVPKNLRNTLNADLLWDSSDLRERARALKLRIAQHLGEHKASPLYGRVIIGENARSLTRCITIDAISAGLERSNFIGSFARNEVRRAGTFYRETNEATFASLTPFLELCLQQVRNEVPLQWNLGNASGGFVFINSGVESLIRIFGDIVDHLVDQHTVIPSDASADALHRMSEPYIEHVTRFLNGLSVEEAAEFRRLYGSGGPTRYWRRLQTALHDADPSFSPSGFAEYLRDQEKQFNTESFEMIRDIEQYLNHDVRRRLQDKFQARWFKDGVPFKVQQAATQLALEKNRDREPEDEVDEWGCLHLIDYHKIITDEHARWQELFAKQYTRPGEEQKPGGWRHRSDWLIEVNRIRNKNDHDYTVTEDEHEFLVSVTTWLVRGQAENDL